MRQRENRMGYAFALPWLLGFFIFTLYPMCSSLYYSFTNYNTLKAPKWIGLRNYIIIFTSDPLFWKSLWNTVYYAVLSVPLGIAAGDCAAVKPESEGNAVFQNHFLFADRCILSCGFSAVDVDSGT